MADYNFKKFHIRAINAATEEEKQAINQELKDLYASLSEEDKAVFNEQLQKFLIQETARLKSDYESVNGVNSQN